MVPPFWPSGSSQEISDGNVDTLKSGGQNVLWSKICLVTVNADSKLVCVLNASITPVPTPPAAWKTTSQPFGYMELAIALPFAASERTLRTVQKPQLGVVLLVCKSSAAAVTILELVIKCGRNAANQ